MQGHGGPHGLPESLRAHTGSKENGRRGGQRGEGLAGTVTPVAIITAVAWTLLSPVSGSGGSPTC